MPQTLSVTQAEGAYAARLKELGPAEWNALDVALQRVEAADSLGAWTDPFQLDDGSWRMAYASLSTEANDFIRALDDLGLQLPSTGRPGISAGPSQRAPISWLRPHRWKRPCSCLHWGAPTGSSKGSCWVRSKAVSSSARPDGYCKRLGPLHRTGEAQVLGFDARKSPPPIE